MIIYYIGYHSCRPREDNLSDHEEEFYYEELEQSEMDEMTSNMEG